MTATATVGPAADEVLEASGPERATPAENPHAGQGSVLLDIGGDVGALLVRMPSALVGIEVEIRSVGAGSGVARHEHEHGVGHEHGAGHRHGHGHDHPHADGALPHVAVVERTAADGTRMPSLVYPELAEGRYELLVKGSDVVELATEVVGGEVAVVDWDASA